MMEGRTLDETRFRLIAQASRANEALAAHAESTRVVTSALNTFILLCRDMLCVEVTLPEPQN